MISCFDGPDYSLTNGFAKKIAMAPVMAAARTLILSEDTSFFPFASAGPAT